MRSNQSAKASFEYEGLNHYDRFRLILMTQNWILVIKKKQIYIQFRFESKVSALVVFPFSLRVPIELTPTLWICEVQQEFHTSEFHDSLMSSDYVRKAEGNWEKFPVLRGITCIFLKLNYVHHVPVLEGFVYPRLFPIGQSSSKGKQIGRSCFGLLFVIAPATCPKEEISNVIFMLAYFKFCSK